MPERKIRKAAPQIKWASSRAAKAEIKPLDRTASRAFAAARLFDIVAEWKQLDIELGALHGAGSVTDLLKEFGPQTDKNGPVLGRQAAPTEGFSSPGQSDNSLFDAGLPASRRHRSTAGLGVPDPADVGRGSTGYGGQARTPVPGRSTTHIEPGGKVYVTLMTDGSTIAVGEGWRGGAYHVFTSERSATGETQVTTVITTTDGRTATYTDYSGGTSNPRSTATGDPEVIRDEQERESDEGASSEFDPAPPAEPAPTPQPAPAPNPTTTSPTGTNVDPDSAYGNNPWGYYNPFTGQYWGPYQKYNVNHVNPGREETAKAGPALRLDPRILVVNPNPEAMAGPAHPQGLTPGTLHTTPGARPPKPRK